MEVAKGRWIFFLLITYFKQTRQHTQLKLKVEQLDRPFTLTFMTSVLAIAKFNMFTSSTACMEYGKKVINYSVRETV